MKIIKICIVAVSITALLVASYFASLSGGIPFWQILIVLAGMIFVVVCFLYFLFDTKNHTSKKDFEEDMMVLKDLNVAKQGKSAAKTTAGKWYQLSIYFCFIFLIFSFIINNFVANLDTRISVLAHAGMLMILVFIGSVWRSRKK